MDRRRIALAMSAKRVDLGSPNTFKNVLRLMIPAMLSQFIAVLYNIVDRIYIGNLPENGEISLIGVGVCAPITNLITSFAFWVVLGACPLFSMSLGQENEKDAKKIFTNALWMLGAFSLILLAVCYGALKPMLYAFGASGESFAYAFDYMLFFLIGVPFAMFATGLNQFLIAQGKSYHAMTGNLVSAVLNIVLDPLFMYTFRLGIKGAAIATTIAWAANFVIALFFSIFAEPVKPIKSAPSPLIVGKILKLGLAPFIILSTDSVIVIGLNIALEHSGANGDFLIECSTIVQAFFSLVTGPLLGISTGTQAVLAYLYGARKVDLVKKAELQITICGLIFTTICFVSSFFTAEPFARLFLLFANEGNSSGNVVSSSAKFIHWYMIPTIILTFQYTCLDGLTGMGQAKYSIWLSVNRKLVMLLPLTFLLPLLSGNGEMAFLAEPIADGVASIVSITVFLIIFPKILKKQKDSTGSALELS